MTEAQIIENMKVEFEKGLDGLTDEEKLAIIPKINSAVNMACVDKMFELTNMDE